MIAVLDVDGTLVDTNYHHAVAWFRAFREVGVTVPVWRVHRAIGMGGGWSASPEFNAVVGFQRMVRGGGLIVAECRHVPLRSR